jgi:hypothetical protein
MIVSGNVQRRESGVQGLRACGGERIAACVVQGEISFCQHGTRRGLGTDLRQHKGICSKLVTHMQDGGHTPEGSGPKVERALRNGKHIYFSTFKDW